MSTQAMPDKWAIKIESEAEAVQLQALFPDDLASNGISMMELITEAIKSYPLPVAFVKDFVNSQYKGWCYSPPQFYLKYGYTIYTLSQLKELLK